MKGRKGNQPVKKMLCSLWALHQSIKQKEKI
jgi:hypothetical protein